MKNVFYIITIIVFVFTSCKQTKYTEVGFGGNGIYSVQNGSQHLIKREMLKQCGEKESLECQNPETHSNSIVYKELKIENPHKRENNKHLIPLIKEKVAKLKIPKSKAEIKKTIQSNKKMIFDYIGENNAMTWGFNLIMYSLIGFVIFGLSAALTSNHPDIGTIMGIGLSILGLIVGSVMYFIGWIVSLSY